MKPGARARPAPSISRAPRSATRPTAAMRPPLTARSPCAATRAQDRLMARRERERRGEEPPDAHQGARDDHAEPLREAERDALAVAARAALGHDVARHLQDRGRHASEPAPELAGGRLRAGG